MPKTNTHYYSSSSSYSPYDSAHKFRRQSNRIRQEIKSSKPLFSDVIKMYPNLMFNNDDDEWKKNKCADVIQRYKGFCGERDGDNNIVDAAHSMLKNEYDEGISMLKRIHKAIENKNDLDDDIVGDMKEAVRLGKIILNTLYECIKGRVEYDVNECYKLDSNPKSDEEIASHRNAYATTQFYFDKINGFIDKVIDDIYHRSTDVYIPVEQRRMYQTLLNILLNLKNNTTTTMNEDVVEQVKKMKDKYFNKRGGGESSSSSDDSSFSDSSDDFDDSD